jgi:hypothetical protein
VTFQEPEIEDVIRRIYEEGLLLPETRADNPPFNLEHKIVY